MHPLAKNILLFLVVIGPMFWLIGTEDGRRRTDILMLEVFGGTSINMRLESLSSTATEDDFKNNFPDLDFNCQNTVTPYGDRVCNAEIAGLNGIPSEYLSLFFYDQQLQAMKVVYRRGYHNRTFDLMRAIFGEPLDHPSNKKDGDAKAESVPEVPGTENKAAAQAAPAAPSNPIERWRTDGGLIIFHRPKVSIQEEPAILWVSDRLLQQQAAGAQ